MKFKRLMSQYVWLLASLIAGLSCASCTKDEPKEEVYIGPEGEESYLDHVFQEVVVPKKIKTTSYVSQLGSYLNLTFEGDIYRDQGRPYAVPKPLSEFRKRIGDEYRKGAYINYAPFGRRTLTKGLVSLEIVSVDGYNAKYPAGSSLAPIVKVDYSSFDVNFEQAIALGGGSLPKMKSYYRLLSEGIADAKLPGSTLTLSFLEAPSQPKVELSFVVTFDDGTTLEDTEELEIR